MINIEIKVRYRKTSRTDKILKKIGARFEKTEIQKDTYFNVDRGRLKIRERDPDTPQLIQYFREEEKGPRPSYYEIVHLKNVEKVKGTLEHEHGIRGVVKKRREIWVWKNVRIHFDVVEDLGEFLELESVLVKDVDTEEGGKRVKWLMGKLGISKKDLIGQSYVDLLIERFSG